MPPTAPRGAPSRTTACRRPPTAYAPPSLRLPAAPEAQRWAPRVREETWPRHLPQSGSSPPPGRVSCQDEGHPPTRDGAPLVRAGSPPRGRLSPPGRAGTVRHVPCRLARGTAGTGRPAPTQRRACARGLQRHGVVVASLCSRRGWRPSWAARGPAPRSVSGGGPSSRGRPRRGRQGLVGQGVGAGWHAERRARRAGGGTPRLPRRCPAPPGTRVWWAGPARCQLPTWGDVVRRSVGGGTGEASRRSPVPAPVPNKGVQATASSFRFASAFSRA